MFTRKQIAAELEEIRTRLEALFVPGALVAEDGKEFPQLTPDQMTVVIQWHASLNRRCLRRLDDTETTELEWLFEEAAERIDDLDPEKVAAGLGLWLFAETRAKASPQVITRARETHRRQWAKVGELGG